MRIRSSQRSASSITWLETSSVAPARGEGVERGPQVAAQDRIEPDRRLVQHQEVGIADERARERHARALPAREGPHDLAGVRPEIDRRDRLVDALERGVEDAREVGEVLAHGEVAVDRRRLGDVADAAPVLLASPPATRAPSTSPDSTIWTPTIARMSVVLPEPLGPSRPVTMPGRTASEIPAGRAGRRGAHEGR